MKTQAAQPLARLAVAALCLAYASTAVAQDFSYNPPGALTSGSGRGRADETVYVPGMRYPIEQSPSFANSQVWGVGGSQGPSGSQCDARNYSYPWSDNYCESRQWDMPLCPSGTGHQGQDIRAATCEDKRWWAVAAEDGSVTNIGTYSVTLMGASGTKHRYLHMDAGTLAVRVGQQVRRGDRMGLVSNEFGGTPTSIHLHYDLFQTIQGVGGVYVPPYLSLVESYEELIGQEAVPCAEISPDGATLDNDGPCARLYGPPATWREVTNAGHAGSLRWTYAWTSANPGNWARFSLHFVEAGSYELAVNTLPEYATSRQTPYKVRSAGQERDLRFDLTADPQPDGWLVLGRFDFAAGGDQWVDVYDNSGETSDQQRRIMADALRVTRVRPQPDPEPEPDLPDDEPDLPDDQDASTPDLPGDNNASNNADNNSGANNADNNANNNSGDNNANNNGGDNNANNSGANNADDGRDNNSAPNNPNSDDNNAGDNNAVNNSAGDNNAGDNNASGGPTRFEESCAVSPADARPSGLWALLVLGALALRRRSSLPS